MKKQMKYWGLVTLVTVMSFCFSSCANDEDAGSKEVRVWIDNQIQPVNTYEFTINGNLIENTVDFDRTPLVKFPVKISRSIAEDVHVKVEIRNSEEDLAAYNAANGTGYEIMPAESINLLQKEVTIKADDLASVDSIAIALKGDGLRATKFYWISVVLTDVQSNDKGVSLPSSPLQSSSYLIVKGAGETSILVDNDLYKKTTAVDRSKWIIKATNTPSTVNMMKDGDVETMWKGYKGSITVDMGEEVELKGLSFTSAYIYWFIEEDYFWGGFRKIEVFLGKSEMEMLSVGSVELPKKETTDEPACVRFAPTTARFFKVNLLSKWGVLSFFPCAELNAYK